MDKTVSFDGSDLRTPQQPGIRFLVETALRQVSSNREIETPPDRTARVAQLVEALISDSELSHTSVIASLMARGVGRQEIVDHYIPAAARRLGELWVSDQASFVDVTVGAGRLQAMIRSHAERQESRVDRSIPLGQSFLMIVPGFESHSLGAFLAADQLRRHGIWVHMAIAMTREELVEFVAVRGFSVLGLSAATGNALEKAADLIDYLRAKLDHVPPIVVGGRVVGRSARVAELTGADHAVRTAREAVERCGLSSVGTGLNFERLDRRARTKVRCEE